MTRDERLLHEAAECAGVQGLFPEYYHALLTGGAQVVAHEPWHEVALAIGVPDIRRFDACVRSEKYAAQRQRDNQEAAELGIVGTPTTYVNGLRIEGAMPRADLVQLIAAELRSSGLPSAEMAARGGFPMDSAGSHH